MNLGLSHLCISEENEKEVFQTMSDLDINNLEIVFSKINSWQNITDKDVTTFRKKLLSFGIESKTTQSLLFGVDIISFSDQAFVKQMIKVIETSKKIGVHTLVLGSPSQRKKTEDYREKISKNFQYIDRVLIENDVMLCVEPNTKIYGGEYFFDVHEIVSWIIENKFSNIKTMIDTHNSLLEERNYLDEFIDFKDFIYHIHISEPNLGNFSKSELHQSFAHLLKVERYNHMVTYEVKSNPNLIESIQLFHQTYS